MAHPYAHEQQKRPVISEHKPRLLAVKGGNRMKKLLINAFINWRHGRLDSKRQRSDIPSGRIGNANDAPRMPQRIGKNLLICNLMNKRLPLLSGKYKAGNIMNRHNIRSAIKKRYIKMRKMHEVSIQALKLPEKRCLFGKRIIRRAHSRI